MDDLNDYLLDIDPDENYYEESVNDNHSFSVYDSYDEFLVNYPISSNENKCLTILSQNIRSFNTNLDNFLLMFDEDSLPDVFIFSETWHKLDTPVTVPGYVGYHTVRQGRSGGVSVFVKNYLNSCFVENLSYANNSIETCSIKISNSRSSVFICGIYRPQSSTTDAFSSSLENILNNPTINNFSCVFAGDFNTNLFSETEDVKMFIEMMRSHHYIQVITDVTHPGINQAASSLIDHIWLNDLSYYNSGILKTGITDHYTLLVQIPFIPNSPSKLYEIKFRDFNSNNHNIFKERLINFDWNTIRSDDTNQFTSNFLDNLNKIFQDSFPLRTKQVSSKYFKNPWHDSHVKNLSKWRMEYYNLYKEGLVTHGQYASYRNKITSLIRKCKENYYNSIFTRNMGNIKICWKLINKICKDSHSKTINKIVHNGVPIENPTDIAELFNSYFTNIATSLANNLPNTADNPYHAVRPNMHDPIFFSPVSNEECANVIQDLKISKQDINILPISFFKQYYHHFLPLICNIINKCFESGTFPNCLKHAIVVPIYKKGDCHEISNYRPIAILPYFSKIIERCIFNRLIDYGNLCNLFTQNQFGFTKGRSTQDAIILVTERIYECFDRGDGSFCINVFVDFKKCFDTLNHEILISKLRLYGIIGLPLQLFSSYLENRTQSVRIGSTISTSLPLNIGVPQGSILGPLLFLFFINDLPNISNNSVPVLFADDLTLSFNCSNINEANLICNQTLEELFKWTNANKLSINFGRNKTYYIVHTFRNINQNDLVLQINGNILENLDEAPFLGVTIDKKLTYRSHIDNISSKISKSVGVLYKLSSLKLPKSILLQVYYSLIYSYLNYNACCYLGTYNTHINRLIILQKRAIRIISGVSFYEHTDPLFNSRKILKITDIYNLNVGLYMYDRWNTGAYDRHHQYETRNRNDLLPRRANLSVTQNSLHSAGPNLWNSIPEYIRSSSTKSSFKCQYKKYLISLYDTDT